MIEKNLLNKVITFPCGHKNDTLQDMLEDFENNGLAEFWYKGKTYYVWRQTNKLGEYLPAISGENGTFDDSWQFFNTWEELVEKFKLFDGKTMLDVIFIKE